MKLKIPPEVQIGAHTFRIRWGNKFLDAANLRGHEDTNKQIIRLHTEQSPSATFEDLLHELDHAISYVFGIKAGHTEAIVMARSAGFAQVLMSMGIEPDFSEIPEEENP